LSRPTRPPRPRALASWCLFDWANQGYPTVIETFVFATFFTQAVAVSPVVGTTQWGYAVAAAGAMIVLLSPVLGAIADRGGRLKPWLMVLSGLCVTCCTLLWFTKPSPDYVTWALVFFALSALTYELAVVFYNAMLPTLVPSNRLGRLSGWGWATGYAGGLACLVFILFGFVEAERPLFGVSREEAEHVRVSVLVVAAWWVVFSIPLFLFTPDKPATGVSLREAIRDGIAALIHTLRNIRQHREVARFLVARTIYNDGLNTLFAFGAIYAAGTFGMDTAEVIKFGIALSVTAGLGALSFSWIDDYLGSKPTILIGLASLMTLGSTMLLIDSVTWFWIVGCALGLFFGPVQSASRALMARLAPPELSAEMFGLYALSGKIVAFLGPLVLALATDIFESQRAGMATILLFFLVGFAILVGVREPAHGPSSEMAR
jgi:MFS transporter, UMF1 family